MGVDLYDTTDPVKGFVDDMLRQFGFQKHVDTDDYASRLTSYLKFIGIETSPQFVSDAKSKVCEILEALTRKLRNPKQPFTLLVDDEAGWSDYLTRKLKGEGYAVSLAINQKISNINFNRICLDFSTYEPGKLLMGLMIFMREFAQKMKGMEFITILDKDLGPQMSALHFAAIIMLVSAFFGIKLTVITSSKKQFDPNELTPILYFYPRGTDGKVINPPTIIEVPKADITGKRGVPERILNLISGTQDNNNAPSPAPQEP